MSERESHCPFLNRADYRCSNHFSLDHLARAFDHCFGQYQACAAYQEMLGERRANQPALERAGGHLVTTSAGLTGTVYTNITVRTRPAHVTVNAVRLPAQHAAA